MHFVTLLLQKKLNYKRDAAKISLGGIVEV